MTLPDLKNLDLAEARRRAAAAPDRYAVVDARHGTELGFYAPVGRDPQTPHERDELYLVASGSDTFRRGEERVPFGPGDLLFVPAGADHCFESFTEDFGTWVLFYATRTVAGTPDQGVDPDPGE